MGVSTESQVPREPLSEPGLPEQGLAEVFDLLGAVDALVAQHGHGLVAELLHLFDRSCQELLIFWATDSGQQQQPNNAFL